MKITAGLGTLVAIQLISSLGCVSKKVQSENVNRTGREFTLEQKWVRQVPEVPNLYFRKINRMTPVFFSHPEKGELVVQGNSIDGIVAYTRDYGFKVWEFRIPNGVESSAAVINDRLFVGGLDGQFYSIDLKTGTPVWSHPTRFENLSEPVLDEGIVYFLTGNNAVFALDAATGKQLWLYTRQDTNSLSIRGGSKPAIRGDSLYFGTSDGYIVSLLKSNGSMKWEKQLSKNKRFKDLDSDPIIDGNFIYAVGFDDSLYALRVATGDLAWKSPVGGYGKILANKDYLFYSTTAGEFVKVSKENGKKEWATSILGDVSSGASFFKGMVVFGEAQGQLKFVDQKSGRLIKSFAPGRGVFSVPAVDEEKSQVAFVSNEGNLWLFHADWKENDVFPFLKVQNE